MKNKNYFILLVLFLSALQIKAQYSFDNVLYGAAYYHEYMPYERLDEDILSLIHISEPTRPY